MDIDTGKVRAMASLSEQQFFNNVTQAHRQPGSIFKLFTYITALKQGMAPIYKFSCNDLYWSKGKSKFKLPPCRLFDVPINFYTAFAYSENTIAWRAAQEVGMKSVVETAHQMGISSELDADDYGTVIGQGEKTNVTPLEMLRAFGAVANRGIMPNVQLIENVSNTRWCKDPIYKLGCNRLLNSDDIYESGKRVIDSKVADDMDQMLRGVVSSGTGQLAKIELLPDIAGKTGTNGVDNDSRDLWFVGYSRSQNVITLVWLGNSDKEGEVIRSYDLYKNLKGHLGAQIWKQYMMATIKRDQLQKLPILTPLTGSPGVDF
jgi:membrane peptidoglycan carboxypeptidase